MGDCGGVEVGETVPEDIAVGVEEEEGALADGELGGRVEGEDLRVVREGGDDVGVVRCLGGVGGGGGGGGLESTEGGPGLAV